MRTNLVRLACVLIGFAAGRALFAAWVWLWREEVGQRAWAARNGTPKSADTLAFRMVFGRTGADG
jgi:hypothetical protein